jgi:hypothetical protein
LMPDHDTSPGDDEPTAGGRLDDWVGVAKGERSARWSRGRFRNAGAQGCSTLVALALLSLVALTAVLISVL